MAGKFPGQPAKGVAPTPSKQYPKAMEAEKLAANGSSEEIKLIGEAIKAFFVVTPSSYSASRRQLSNSMSVISGTISMADWTIRKAEPLCSPQPVMGHLLECEA